ncbi:M23 family metallopeptidase [Ascidiimonas sp. W6]|uniref:M23 family metallopeptidase n=1 Tax=Ascidiimonas meishanensis TaxID=3128903 RepID=UPI0030EED515
MRQLFVFFFFVSHFLLAQSTYPKNLFRSPLDVPVYLSGTFGELRSNHFHSGIDIKTQQREGLPIYAIGDGYISRIKISPWGFGKAVYITHPNGNYTSVYAHLQKLNSELQEYIKKLQYEQKSYAVEIYPEATTFKVAKGTIIAYSGNSGSSGGPHLHFEIRDSSQRPINPLHFGIAVKDKIAPTVNALFGYTFDQKSHINQSNLPIRINLNEIKPNEFQADKVIASGKIGFGINTFDRQDGTYNKNGIYRVEMKVNDIPYFSYDLEKFSFTETRYINAHIDYNFYKTNKNRIQKIFKWPKNPLSIYRLTKNDGIIVLKEGENYDIEIKITDFAGNKSVIKIPVQGKNLEIKRPTDVLITDRFLRSSIDNIYELNKASIYFPAHTFYENFYIDLKDSDSLLQIHHHKIPVHKKYQIKMDISEYPEAEKNKLFVAHISEEGDLYYESTKRKGNQLIAKTRSLGNFKIAKDTTPPVVKSFNYKEGKWLSNYRYLKIRIYDDLSGIDTFKATLNNQWILMEYDPKTKLLVYDFEDLNFKETKHYLKLIVTDNVGNNTTFTSTFYKKK